MEKFLRLAFYAEVVECNEAIDGELVQVTFQEKPDEEQDGLNFQTVPAIKSVTFSINYEFPPAAVAFEWCDGKEFDGGCSIRLVELTDNALIVELCNGNTFEVRFNTDQLNLKKINCIFSTALAETSYNNGTQAETK